VVERKVVFSPVFLTNLVYSTYALRPYLFLYIFVRLVRFIRQPRTGSCSTRMYSVPPPKHDG
jgi:hypothetical protein